MERNQLSQQSLSVGAINTQRQELERLQQELSQFRSTGDKLSEALTLVKLGSIYQTLGATTLALERYNQALELYRAMGNRDRVAFTLTQMGNAYKEEVKNLQKEASFHQIHEFYSPISPLIEQKSQNRDKAVEFYNQALQIYREIRDRAGEAEVLKNLGQLASTDDGEAVELYQQALNIYQEIREGENNTALNLGEAQVLSNLSEINLIELGNDKKGWDFWNRAWTIYQAIPESLVARQGEANLLNIGATHYWWSENRQKALEFHYQALEIHKESGDKQGEARTLKIIGDRYSFLENRQKELESYNQSLTIYREVSDLVGEVDLLNRLGFTYLDSDNKLKALELYEKELEKLKEASQFYSQLGDSKKESILENRQSTLLITMGKQYDLLGESEKSFAAYQQAQNIHQKRGDRAGEVEILLAIADLYKNLGNAEKTIEFSDRALAIYRQTGDRLREANLLRHQIAPLYLHGLKDSEKGLMALQKALAIYKEIGDNRREASTLFTLGNTYFETLERPEEALIFYDRAILIYQEIDDFSQEVFALRTVGKLYYEIGNKDEALEVFNRAGKVYQENGDRAQELKILIEIGRDYNQLEDKATALEFYLRAIPLARQLEDYKKEAHTLRTIGTLYYELENPSKAIATFNRARNVYLENSDRAGAAWTLYETGKSYETLGDLKNAIASYQQARALYEQEENAPFREERMLDSLMRLGRLYSYTGELQKALDFCDRSLIAAQNFPESKIVARSEMFRKVGKLCYQIGDREKALASFEQYWKIYQKLGRDREVVSLVRIGKDYVELGDSEQALAFFERARKVYQDSNLTEGEANLLGQIGQIYGYLGDNGRAVEFYNQELAVARKIGDLNQEAIALAHLGDLYAEFEDVEKALPFYNQALEIYRKLGNHREEAKILNAIAMLYKQLEKPEKALEFHQKSLKISQENDLVDRASTTRKIGQLYYQLGDLENALDFFKQTLQPTERKNAAVYTDLGKVYAELGEVEKARELFDKSLSLNHRYSEIQAENLFGIAVVERKLGHFDSALSQIEDAIALIEKERASKQSQGERQTFFATKQNYYEFYIDLLMELHQQHPNKGYDAQALHLNERSRARSLLELLAESNADIRKGINLELAIQERNLQQQLDAVEQRRVALYSSDYTLEQQAAIEQERQYLLRQYQAVQGEIRKTSPSYAAIAQPQPLTLKQIQQQVLDKDTLLLQYSLGKERSYLWAVTQDTLTSYELPPRAEIEVAARRFYRQLNDPRFGIKGTQSLVAVTANSEPRTHLSQLILSPVASQLNQKRLLVVGDGALQYIPFAALPTPGNENFVPLVRDREIVNLPSTSTLAILRQETQNRKLAPHQIALLADPVFATEDDRLSTSSRGTGETPKNFALNRSAEQLDIGVWQRLPGTRKEAEAIMQLVPESQRTQVFDFAASREFVTQSDLSQYQIIHFATHGILNSTSPELSGIVLSLFNEQGNPQNGFLRLHDVFNLNLPAELVVLSACQTGLGQQVKGEGLVGLTRGFMYAGAPRVLVSLWNVHDAATAEMMKRFYRLLLQEKLTAPAALRQAQLEMQTQTRWKHPYYWAAFTLQGEWN
ncbi:tetratricopeptide repeat protein [Lusitaniella coriacea LEGE 07157]|uniref:Tetratricopeptide repeat protein n=1 Tax=Lusitaniella coriacea LEGE 07157 TaxID=945747 RepID=A0A8J7B0S5_9CYAN|nr:tetratricopeptide repeat protein [Lusitaniella coriacea]MBE9115125.1 tetratricopeptide repeat protein [Lusitaniella coriacea LEGE 07157]